MSSAVTSVERTPIIMDAFEALNDSERKRVKLAHEIGREVIENGGITHDRTIFLAAMTGALIIPHINHSNEAIYRIFEEIYRAESALNGTGRPLALVTSSNDLHALGRVGSFEGQPEDVSQFRFRLQSRGNDHITGSFEVPMVDPLVRGQGLPKDRYPTLVDGVYSEIVKTLAADYSARATSEGVGLYVSRDRQIHVGSRAVSQLVLQGDGSHAAFLVKYVDELTAVRD